MIAVGIGCRAGASKDAIVSLVVDALASLALTPESASFFTYEGKRNEAGLLAAADTLSISLTFLSSDRLQAVADKITLRSEAAEKALGIPSVAEAAALAGCGGPAVLLLPRTTGHGVTCAIATGIEA